LRLSLSRLSLFLLSLSLLQGRFTMAARYHSNIAEICESELVDFEQAITHYEQAADYYKGEDSTGSANKCLLKVAHMAAMLQQFDKAAGIFEEVFNNISSAHIH
jgi:alpha-soluble NSF attachment protein